ncbi:MAG: SsrA-binding protein [Marinomonas sp.]|jgi:SsrA-binding protein|uniref:SsrA-binding protein n=1 Tax=Marinomonas communis TaxID=28254 RepID=A0A4R6X0R7_9GAMM|nr:SsrA-binding protein SmpB [Marinomonas communis]MAF15053.1 SsrA-binding protein [Marinomonas sp.]MEC8082769.1 SsrA-binding protein SmpB [Pseudomonadota bacterium]MCC4275847.1 SsrA-binding protein SmpB [Marinomonas communis]MEC8483326.1 SsrA-binding protein SmpB [Pseudomonadota bacterium]RUM53227.1 MAG: SsrA-binding protein [Marinomonas sp.]|tara:strand:- start:966 stop:1445 length:480 start_codon:yes stop_codon:yes gene_type:complete
MSKAKKKPNSSGTIALNKRARHEYFIDQKFEAGLELSGWEVKSLREGKAQLVDSYVIIHRNEAYLINARITPLLSASTHVVCEPLRQRKLLMHRKEIDRIIQVTEQKGKTCAAMALYWKGNKIKCEVALVTGKKDHDKRDTAKERDWARDKERLMKAKF